MYKIILLILGFIASVSCTFDYACVNHNGLLDLEYLPSASYVICKDCTVWWVNVSPPQPKITGDYCYQDSYDYCLKADIIGGLNPNHCKKNPNY